MDGKIWFNLIPDEDVQFTNWGITGNELEPLDVAASGCVSMCLGTQCNGDHTWKTESCSATMDQFLCQAECRILSCFKSFEISSLILLQD